MPLCLLFQPVNRKDRKDNLLLVSSFILVLLFHVLLSVKPPFTQHKEASSSVYTSSLLTD